MTREAGAGGEVALWCVGRAGYRETQLATCLSPAALHHPTHSQPAPVRLALPGPGRLWERTHPPQPAWGPEDPGETLPWAWRGLGSTSNRPSPAGASPGVRAAGQFLGRAVSFLLCSLSGEKSPFAKFWSPWARKEVSLLGPPWDFFSGPGLPLGDRGLSPGRSPGGGSTRVGAGEAQAQEAAALSLDPVRPSREE